MVDISVPRTPTPQAISPDAHMNTTPDSKSEATILQMRDVSAVPTTPPSQLLELTPPMSSQVPQLPSQNAPFDKIRPTSLASPPPTLKATPIIHNGGSINGAFTMDQVKEMHESQLRDLIFNLSAELGEARMNYAHAKLQHNLLMIETAESAQRAEVEHEMTRREIEILRSASPARERPSPWTDAGSPQVPPYQLQLALKRIKDLEAENTRLERRLKQAKKIIKHLDGKNTQLAEDNELLRERIKQNREHMDALQSSTAFLSNQPFPNSTHTTPHQRLSKQLAATPSSTRVASQDPFDILLSAAQVPNGEQATSVPSTPTHPRPMKFTPGHTRGTHSLSSLPVTPNHSRPLTADNILHTPTNRPVPSSHHPSMSAPIHHPRQHIYIRDTPSKPPKGHSDRDSTISASDAEEREQGLREEREEVLTDDEIPASQASRAATNMLRPFSASAASSFETTPTTSNIPQQKFTQSKLAGKVVKSSFDRANHLDTTTTVQPKDEGERARKKTKLDIPTPTSARLGLGIGMWPSPS